MNTLARNGPRPPQLDFHLLAFVTKCLPLSFTATSPGRRLRAFLEHRIDDSSPSGMHECAVCCKELIRLWISGEERMWHPMRKLDPVYAVERREMMPCCDHRVEAKEREIRKHKERMRVLCFLCKYASVHCMENELLRSAPHPAQFGRMIQGIVAKLCTVWISGSAKKARATSGELRNTTMWPGMNMCTCSIQVSAE